MPEIPPVRVFLRPVGTPLTIGMAGLGIASFTQSGYELGWVGVDQAAVVGIVLISVPFVLQLVGSIFAYLARDGASGATMGILSTSWLALGLVHIVTPPGSVSGGIGLMQLAAGVALFLSGFVVGQSSQLAGAVFLVEALRFVLGGAYHLGAGEGLQNAAGVVGLVVTALAAFLVFDSAQAGSKAGLGREPGVRDSASPLSGG